MFGDIANSEGERLDYSFHEGSAASRDVVVIGHGVTGNKDRPFVIALAEGLAAAGINALRFSFAGNGDSGGRFVDATISKEVEDLGSVMDALAGYRIIYVGHSMGGAVGVLHTSRDERVRALVSLAGMVHTQAFAEREFGDVEPGVGCMWEDEDCPLSQQYVDDMAQIDSVVELGAKIAVPWLLVHGSEDDVVPPGDATDIIARAPHGVEQVVIDGANHVFSEHADQMVQIVVEWVQRELTP
jgi:pimeloyl-ACP methyl ester carboxylesterase